MSSTKIGNDVTKEPVTATSDDKNDTDTVMAELSKTKEAAAFAADNSKLHDPRLD